MCYYSARWVTDVESADNHCISTLLLPVYSYTANVTVFHVEGWYTIFMYTHVSYVHVYNTTLQLNMLWCP